MTPKREKFKKLIILVISNLTTPLRKLKSFHERIKQVKESDLAKSPDRNPYEQLTDWLLDTITFGFLCLITYHAIMAHRLDPSPNWITSLLVLFGTGVLPTIISTLRSAIKGE